MIAESIFWYAMGDTEPTVQTPAQQSWRIRPWAEPVSDAFYILFKFLKITLERVIQKIIPNVQFPSI